MDVPLGLLFTSRVSGYNVGPPLGLRFTTRVSVYKLGLPLELTVSLSSGESVLVTNQNPLAFIIH